MQAQIITSLGSRYSETQTDSLLSAKASTAAGLATAKESTAAGLEVVGDVAAVVSTEVSQLAADVRSALGSWWR